MYCMFINLLVSIFVDFIMFLSMIIYELLGIVFKV